MPCSCSVGSTESHGGAAHLEPDLGVLLADQQVRGVVFREAFPGRVSAEGGVMHCNLHVLLGGGKGAGNVLSVPEIQYVCSFYYSRRRAYLLVPQVIGVCFCGEWVHGVEKA